MCLIMSTVYILMAIHNFFFFTQFEGSCLYVHVRKYKKCPEKIIKLDKNVRLKKKKKKSM